MEKPHRANRCGKMRLGAGRGKASVHHSLLHIKERGAGAQYAEITVHCTALLFAHTHRPPVPACCGRHCDGVSLMRHGMAKKFPMHPKHPERVCWGCDQYCASDAMKCGNGSDRTMHPAELLGDDWASVGDWGFEEESKAASAQNKKAFDQ
ncbi:DUF3079 domain-containing protein [Achromobacter sp. ESBL13]|uniref:DUF3079 domain-containing protein n=1 Tax=Achromobacter sp. ESBL13 TaxID=3077328 RepID=UPI002FCB5442